MKSEQPSIVADVIRRALQPGERLLWSEQPDPHIFGLHPAGSVWVLGVAVVLSVGLPLFLIVAAFTVLRDEPITTGLAIQITAMTLGFSLLGSYVWFHYLRGRKRARHVIYAVTDQRLLSIRIEPNGSIEVVDFAAGGLALLDATPIKNGVGNIWLAIKVSPREGVVTNSRGFIGVPRCQEIAELIATQPYAARAIDPRPSVTRIEAKGNRLS